MDYKLTDEDKERIKLLNEVQKNKFKNLNDLSCRFEGGFPGAERKRICFLRSEEEIKSPYPDAPIKGILTLEQLIRLEELVEKKDYTHEKKANKSKRKLLKEINIEIYRRDDSAIWK